MAGHEVGWLGCCWTVSVNTWLQRMQHDAQECADTVKAVRIKMYVD